MAQKPLNSLRGNQIKDGAILNQHVADNAAIAESKLAIDWDSHGNEILGKKLVVDFVQVTGVTVTAESSTVSVTDQISGAPAKADTELGPVVQEGKNKIILRSGLTGEPLIGESGREVYGRLTHDESDYTISFYSKVVDEETSETIAEEQVIDFQYPQRFTLRDVVETFASNEKFVDGAADISSRLDLQQIAKDIFGSSYQYDHDGVANNAKTIVQQLADEVKAREDAVSKITDRIDAIHKHYAEDKVIVAEDPLIGQSKYSLVSEDGFKIGDKSMLVYYNGVFQIPGVHYKEVADLSIVTKGVALDFTPTTFELDDTIAIRWSK